MGHFASVAYKMLLSERVNTLADRKMKNMFIKHSFYLDKCERKQLTADSGGRTS